MTAIEFENISKQYRLGLVSTKTLSHDIRRFWLTNVLGKEDPYLKIGETNDRSTRGSSEYVWALRDINFKVEQGDVVGIIGKNGAGKSTLLKLLSRVTGPTTGTIRANGRIGSLLEVGTGFHSEMTGRENIFLNGAILGMTKQEISKKLDEIIDFSGCERYIDTPVKRYSSGMMVRLGFAVAAHLDPEILVVDEVLAVGDAEFQKKAIGKMKDVSKGEGRTVLFVSHNMGSIRNLCRSGIILENGRIKYTGSANDCVDKYLSAGITRDDIVHLVSEEDHYEGTEREIEFIQVGYGVGKKIFATNEEISFVLKIHCLKSVEDFRINCTVSTMDDVAVGSVSSNQTYKIAESEYKTVKLTLFNHNFAMGEYKVSFSVGTGNFSSVLKDYDIVIDVLSFQIDRFDSLSNEAFNSWPTGFGRQVLPHRLELV